MARSVKLADDIMEVVEREAMLQSRSLAGQITHWINLGRAIESSSRFSHQRINAALEGRLDTADLTKDEADIWLFEFQEKVGQESEESKAFFARRRNLGLGVGIGENGKLVHVKDLCHLAFNAKTPTPIFSVG